MSWSFGTKLSQSQLPSTSILENREKLRYLRNPFNQESLIMFCCKYLVAYTRIRHLQGFQIREDHITVWMVAALLCSCVAQVNSGHPVMDVVPAICEQFGITHALEFSLVRDQRNKDDIATQCKTVILTTLQAPSRLTRILHMHRWMAWSA